MTKDVAQRIVQELKWQGHLRQVQAISGIAILFRKEFTQWGKVLDRHILCDRSYAVELKSEIKRHKSDERDRH